MNTRKIYLEEHQRRLVGSTLSEYLPIEWNETISWFQQNIEKITEFVFARGLALELTDHSNYFWYYNYVSVSQNPDSEFLTLFKISDIQNGSRIHSEEIGVGEKNGGSTIQMPFGFLQMHCPGTENQMQFHHDVKKIGRLLDLRIDKKKAFKSGRNHSDAWKKAKITGYEFCIDVLQKLLDDEDFANDLSRKCFNQNLGVIDFDGSNVSARHVQDIFGALTRGKSNLNVVWPTGEHVNISVKSSEQGHVYLVSVNRFIDGFESIFQQIIPLGVKQILKLFIGSDQNMLSEFMKDKKFKGPEYRAKR